MKRLVPAAKLILFLALAIGVQSLIQVAILKSGFYTPTHGWNAPDFALGDGIGFVAALLATALFARFERRPLGSYGLPLRASAIPRWIEGAVWGAGGVSLTAFAVIACGGASFHGLALEGPALLRSALVWLIAMIVLGFFEEYMFRGYALDVLAKGYGFTAAAGVNAILFGALHYYTKPMENLADAVAVALITLFLCFTIARTGSLWFAIGFHAAFDYFALIVYAAPNTGNQGLPIPGHLLDIRYDGASWLTGGPRGLEASAPMFAVVALMFALYAWRTRTRKANAGSAEHPI